MRNHGPDLLNGKLQTAVAGREDGPFAGLGFVRLVDLAKGDVGAKGRWSGITNAAVVGLVDVTLS